MSPPGDTKRESQSTLSRIRPTTLDDLADQHAESDRKIGKLAEDLARHERSEKDHRDLAGQALVELKGLREIALEQDERFDRLDRRLDAIGTSALVAKSEASRAAAGVGQVRDEVASLGRDVADLTAAMIHERADTAKRDRAMSTRTTASAVSSGTTTVLAVIYALAKLFAE